jgi:ankyrin repeat protein
VKPLAYVLVELFALAVLVWMTWAASAAVQQRLPDVPTANEQLLAASWSGDREMFDRSLAAGGSVNARDDTGTTPLHYAALSADTHLVVRLLDLGADPNAKNHAGMTPLLDAVIGENLHVVELLVRRGAAVDGDALAAAAHIDEKRVLPLLKSRRTTSGLSPMPGSAPRSHDKPNPT